MAGSKEACSNAYQDYSEAVRDSLRRKKARLLDKLEADRRWLRTLENELKDADPFNWLFPVICDLFWDQRRTVAKLEDVIYGRS